MKLRGNSFRQLVAGVRSDILKGVMRPDELAVLASVFHDGLSYPEAGKLHGLSTMSVYRLCRKLRRFLEQFGWPAPVVPPFPGRFPLMGLGGVCSDRRMALVA